MAFQMLKALHLIIGECPVAIQYLPEEMRSTQIITLHDLPTAGDITPHDGIDVRMKREERAPQNSFFQIKISQFGLIMLNEAQKPDLSKFSTRSTWRQAFDEELIALSEVSHAVTLNSCRSAKRNLPILGTSC